MTVEENVVTLRESKARVEHLLSYYRRLGDEELAVVKWLEVRLNGITEQMSGQAGARSGEAH